MADASLPWTVTISANLNQDYHGLAALVRARVSRVESPVFYTKTDPDRLWHSYINTIPAEFRRYYTCSCCRQFIKRFGGLVFIDSDGTRRSVCWDRQDTPVGFIPTADRLQESVESAEIGGVYVWGEKNRVWGSPKTTDVKRGREWTHLSGAPTAPPYKHLVYTPGQEMARLRQEYQILSRAVADYPLHVATQALRVLTQAGLPPTAAGMARMVWFRNVHEAIAKTTDRCQGDAILWRFVATAPMGYCYRSGFLGALLDDVVVGTPFDEITRKWAAKLHPLQYVRPQDPPSESAAEQQA